MPPVLPPRAAGRRRKRRGLAGVGREETSRGSELGKTERALRRAGGRRRGGQRPQPGGRGRMEQVEILRKFIQRVQAMKSPDHNGEDNFARDFMVSPSSGCPLLSPAQEPTAASPGRPARALCTAVRRGTEGAAHQPQGPGGLGGRREVRPPPPLGLLSPPPAFAAPSAELGAQRERPLGRIGTQHSRRRPPIVSRSGIRRQLAFRQGFLSSHLPIQPAPPEKV